MHKRKKKSLEVFNESGMNKKICHMKLIMTLTKEPMHCEMKGGKAELNYIFVQLSNFNTKSFKVPLMTQVHVLTGPWRSQRVLPPGGWF